MNSFDSTWPEYNDRYGDLDTPYPRLIAESKAGFRLVLVSKDKFVVERLGTDALGQAAWVTYNAFTRSKGRGETHVPHEIFWSLLDLATDAQ